MNPPTPEEVKTPRTDAAKWSVPNQLFADSKPTEVVGINFARQLETELTQAKQELVEANENLASERQHHMLTVIERDTLRTQLAESQAISKKLWVHRSHFKDCAYHQDPAFCDCGLRELNERFEEALALSAPPVVPLAEAEKLAEAIEMYLCAGHKDSRRAAAWTSKKALATFRASHPKKP